MFFGKKKEEEKTEESEVILKDSNNNQVGLSVEKLTLSNTISIEALIEVLAKKGLIDKKDVLEEVKKLGRHTKIYDEVKKEEDKDS